MLLEYQRYYGSIRKEIIMDTGYYKFYEKKFKILLLLLSCVVFCVGDYFMIKDTDSFYRLVRWVAIIFFGLCFIKWCLKLFSGKAYIEITPTYIQIDNFEKIPWTDIVGVRVFSVQVFGMYGTKSGWLLDVKDVSKYKLTFLQKINSAAVFSPFYIAFSAISDKDKEELKRILKERIPQNNLD